MGRLGYLMINDSSKLKAIAVGQWTNKMVINAKRGRILDTDGNVLALSADVYRVDLDLYTIRQDITHNKRLEDDEVKVKLGIIAKKLSDATGMKYEDVNKIVNQTLKNGKAPGSVNLIRKIEKADADKVDALKINGVMLSSDSKRIYPNENLLAHVLGFTLDDKDQNAVGMYGVEKTYNSILSGTAGNRIAEFDRKATDELPFVTSSYTKPVDGKDLVLTINSSIQQFCDSAADQAMKDYKARAVSIIVSDPNSGEIIAMVNKPDYNPNKPITPGKTSTELNQEWRNRAVMDIFEPGSIMKVVTAAAAMQEGVVKENDSFDCKGELIIDKRTIHCDEPHGLENFPDIIKKSCNVGFMELGRRLGKERLNNYVKLFGFGQKTGVDLNDEAIGIVKKTENLSDGDLATLSFGQVDSVSCIQYIAAFNAVANGGTWIRPHVMKDFQHVDENNKTIVDQTYTNLGTKKILDTDIAKTLRGYLEKVVTEGTATNTYIEGYHIAGKTGTAQKAINGGYPEGKYVCSFAGMAPADKPQYTVIVSVDEPDPATHFAAQTAVPVAKLIFQELFSNLTLSTNSNIPPIYKNIILPEVRGLNKADAIKSLKDKHITVDIDNNGDYIANMDPLPGTTIKEGSKITLTTAASAVNSKVVVMPELKGYTRDKAQETLDGLGLNGYFQGDGTVSGQNRAAGEQINKGSTITFYLKTSAD